MAAAAVAGPKDGSAVSVFLDSIYPTNRHVFLQPPPLLPDGSLQLAKETLDALAGQISDQQQQRLQETRKKRKRREGGHDQVLKIRKLHIDGFETGQIWQQAKKIISSALQESEEILEELEARQEVTGGTGDLDGDSKLIEFGEDGFEVGSDPEEESTSGSDDLEDISEDDEESDDEEGSELGSQEGDFEGLEDDDLEVDGEVDEEEDDEEEEEEEDEEDEEEAEELVEDPNGLNDGFFSLEEFNKQTQLWEDQDARADPNTDKLDEDEEDLDWHTDPFAIPDSKGSKKGADDMEDDEDDEDIDMDDIPAPKKKTNKKRVEEEDEDDDGDDIGDVDDLGIDNDASDIYYKDFFAPPAKKGGKRGGKNKFKFASRPAQPNDDDVERAMNDTRRDIFDDLSEHSDDEDALSDVSAGDPKSRRSAHERRQAKVAEEIRKLEAELVAKRAWTLSGEASASARPVNSLLEEDLDFEHAGKPVPVITEEVSESIEALIKRRILAHEFDEVLRRRPDTLGDPNGARRGLVDVQDKKGDKSLAELYEEEHVKKANPDAYMSAADEKLKRDEDEIKAMWKDISAKLDALSSWHYKPKPAAPTLTVVADVATVAMEDAQPTTAQGVAGGESMIAPQEVYAPGKDTADKGEVVAKSGLPVAKQEMSREEKLRRRRREKERIRKAGGVDAASGKTLSKKAQAQKETLNDLKKGGVRVINRKGEVMDLDGKKATAGGDKGPVSSGAYKL
ncbi:Mpp10 protein-domain-containing protein [Diplogelasinospora grovesii]|uniref:U3 small nucleolar ribonucleoprotein protein MPP10 n=1 Tax=Diplogelasinospora grovesii TaxID=303347 RepID=A0AAN6S2A9_9PEZI|nr:Mpp10 protein-domain-containing protein [Diplogelasinospora grovesii]